MLDSSEAPSDWPLEFGRLQKMIIGLWQTCHISLIHRTYFLLLFKGDPMDSIYMEVEVRRLSFLKEILSNGNSAVQGGQTITLASRYVLYILVLCINVTVLSEVMQCKFVKSHMD